MNYTRDYVIETIEKYAKIYGSCNKVAKVVGISQPTLNNWKNGKQFPKPETFFKYFPAPEEPVEASRPKQPAVETIYIQNHSDELMRCLGSEILSELRSIYKRSYIKIRTLDYNSILVIHLTRSLGNYGGKFQFTRVYPDPIDHAYLDPEWAHVVAKDFQQAADKWILRQFKY